MLSRDLRDVSCDAAADLPITHYVSGTLVLICKIDHCTAL